MAGREGGRRPRALQVRMAASCPGMRGGFEEVSGFGGWFFTGGSRCSSRREKSSSVNMAVRHPGWLGSSEGQEGHGVVLTYEKEAP